MGTASPVEPASGFEAPGETAWHRWLAAMPRVIEAVGVNAVPLWGVFHGWTFGTLLLLYWSQNLLNTVFIGARLGLHELLTQDPGYTVDAATATITYGTGRDAKQWRSPSLWRSFVVTNLFFSFVHGIFLFGLLTIALQSPIDFPEFGRGLLPLVAAMTVGFLLDLLHLRSRSLAWVRGLAEAAIGRDVVVHLAIIGGMFFLLMTHRDASFFTIFIALKALFEISAALPRRNQPAAAAFAGLPSADQRTGQGTAGSRARSSRLPP